MSDSGQHREDGGRTPGEPWPSHLEGPTALTSNLMSCKNQMRGGGEDVGLRENLRDELRVRKGEVKKGKCKTKEDKGKGD